MGTRLPSFRKYSFSIGSRNSSPFVLFDPLSVALAPVPGGQILPVDAGRREVLTVKSHDSEKGLIGLKNPTIEVPDEYADDVGVDQAPDLPFTIFEIAIKSRILERDRGLRRQQLQDRDPGGSENGCGRVVLNVEHAHQLGLFDQWQTEDRPDVPGSNIFIRRERLFPGGVIGNHRLLGSDDVLQYRQREFRGRHERLSEVDLNRFEAGRSFRLHP